MKGSKRSIRGRAIVDRFSHDPVVANFRLGCRRLAKPYMLRVASVVKKALESEIKAASNAKAEKAFLQCLSRIPDKPCQAASLKTDEQAVIFNLRGGGQRL